MTNWGLYPPRSGRVVNAQLKVLIADITLTNSGSFEAISIPAGFDELEMVCSLRGTVAAAAVNIRMNCNQDFTSANYSSQYTSATGTALNTARYDEAYIGVVAGGTAPANEYSPVRVSLLSSSRTTLKNAYSIGGERQSATVQALRLILWQWESTEPIRNVTFRTDNHATDLFAAGSRVQVFGLGTFAVALAR